ncbi:MAG: hypothetical protein KAT34_08050 [Candidatus Aminicenantes bacterium]|nr:hypothetical protein [Candidatus Aminicenantes bacterium]
MYIKKIPEKYNLFFTLEMIIGLIGFVGVFLLGEIGVFPILLFLVVPFLKKKETDERELKLLYKAAAITFGFFYISVVLIYRFLPETDLPFIIGFPVLFWHGLISIIIFYRE